MLQHDRIYIDGSWVPSAGSGRSSITDPITESVIGSSPDGVAADVDSAVAAARRAFTSWSQTRPEVRADLLRSLHKALYDREQEIADLISAELGVPTKLVVPLHITNPMGMLKAAAELLDSYRWEETVDNSVVVREPIGVVGAITPWNYPLHQVMAKVGSALAAGCTVVLKPSEVAPLSAFLLAEAIDEAGFPPGVFNLVSGRGGVVGEAIAAHPDLDMVTFTGSTQAGKRVAQVAAATVKRVALELGGKSALIILDDVTGDALEKAVKDAVSRAFLNSGQTCSACSRLVVPAERIDEVAAVAAATADRVATRLGPVVSKTQFDRVQGYIATGISEGARLVAGGLGRPSERDGGFYVRPTVFTDVSSSMTIAQEEIFGPVLSILPYAHDDDAVRIANDSIYGLSGGVVSEDSTRAFAIARQLRTGQVDINGAAFNVRAPFGGRRQSGNGRELGVHGFEEFLELKSIQH